MPRSNVYFCMVFNENSARKKKEKKRFNNVTFSMGSRDNG